MRLTCLILATVGLVTSANAEFVMVSQPAAEIDARDPAPAPAANLETEVSEPNPSAPRAPTGRGRLRRPGSLELCRSPDRSGPLSGCLRRSGQ